MLVKRSSKNQIAIPKAVLEHAGLGPEDVYFDIQYADGRIILRAMQVEEKIPAEALARFEVKTLKQEPGDRTYGSVGELKMHLHHRKRSA